MWMAKPEPLTAGFNVICTIKLEALAEIENTDPFSDQDIEN